VNLGYLVAYARKHFPDLEVRIIDGVIGQDVHQKLLEFDPDMVGVTAVSPQAEDAYALGSWIKETFVHPVFRVFGGVHASTCPTEAIPFFDCVVVGEGEKALLQILKSLAEGKQPKFLIEGEPIDDLDEIPMPAYDLMDVAEYIKRSDVPGTPYLLFPKGTKIASLMTTRGCPFKCVFCHNSWRQSKPRWFSAKRVVEEIKYFVTVHGVNGIFFNDDEFLINVARLKEIKRLLVERGLVGKFVWSCQARATTLTHETLTLAKSMGLYCVNIGFESMSQRILAFLKADSMTVQDNERAVKIAKECGVMIGGSFIFGTFDETMKEMQATFKFFEDNENLAYAGINVLTAYPGTKLFHLAKEKGLLPKQIDYKRLIPTSEIETAYSLSINVGKRDFQKFIVNARRIAYIITRVRLIVRSSNHKKWDFLKLFKLHVMWWMMVAHPRKTWKLYRETRRT
jgi:radical SAM superfamily enzyme YgiQ (UPF0313 family)